MPGPSGATSAAKVHCYNCNGMGHYARDCSTASSTSGASKQRERDQRKGREQQQHDGASSSGTGRQHSGTPKTSGGRPNCTHCNKLGHTKEDCRAKKLACFDCGEVGHKAKDCPKSSHDGERAGNSGRDRSHDSNRGVGNSGRDPSYDSNRNRNGDRGRSWDRGSDGRDRPRERSRSRDDQTKHAINLLLKEAERRTWPPQGLPPGHPPDLRHQDRRSVTLAGEAAPGRGSDLN